MSGTGTKKGGTDWITLLVKYRGRCKECGRDINVGEYALWSRSSKAIKHPDCQESSEKSLEKSRPGAREGVEEELKEDGLQNESENESELEFECFICGRKESTHSNSGMSGLHYSMASEHSLFICSLCVADPDAYRKYKAAFLEKLQSISGKS
jgi:hypothetical protein